MIQIFLSIGAITLLSIATLAMNRGFETNDEVMRTSKHAIIATSLASSVIEEATGKAFDESSTDKLVWNAADLTPAGKLGPDDGETPVHCDDADDFSGMKKLDTVDVGGALNKVVFTTRSTVSYVDPGNPDYASAAPTWYKRIAVEVSSPVMADTIRQSVIFSYFRFE
jgi:hypothetical protein